MFVETSSFLSLLQNVASRDNSLIDSTPHRKRNSGGIRRSSERGVLFEKGILRARMKHSVRVRSSVVQKHSTVSSKEGRTKRGERFIILVHTLV